MVDAGVAGAELEPDSLTSSCGRFRLSSPAQVPTGERLRHKECSRYRSRSPVRGPVRPVAKLPVRARWPWLRGVDDDHLTAEAVAEDDVDASSGVFVVDGGHREYPAADVAGQARPARRAARTGRPRSDRLPRARAWPIHRRGPNPAGSRHRIPITCWRTRARSAPGRVVLASTDATPTNVSVGYQQDQGDGQHESRRFGSLRLGGGLRSVQGAAGTVAVRSLMRLSFEDRRRIVHSAMVASGTYQGRFGRVLTGSSGGDRSTDEGD
jgi:hypothetical protein